MSWLAACPTWILVLAFVGGLAVVAVTGRLAGGRIFRGAETSATAVASAVTGNVRGSRVHH